jgi:type I restriction enzyme S subunit
MKAQVLLDKYFETAFSAPDGVKKLRELILSLAMQGKLVPQDPSDQPASELLKEIEAEKERLITEGKIKKSKPLPEITSDEIPYDLPKSWEWVRLGAIGETQTGNTPPTKDIENFGDFIPFINPGDIKNYNINYFNNGLSKIGLLKSRLIKKNSILMVCIGGSIGKHAINNRDVTCNQQINTITPYYNSIKFIFFAMAEIFFQKLIINQSGGSATPIINKQKCRNVESRNKT